MTFEELKKLSFKEFKDLYSTLDVTHCSIEQLYDSIQNAKEGFIWIRRIKPSIGDSYYGWTSGFNENIGCRVSTKDEWYSTSIVKKIDWENHTFDTLNSTYEFKFSKQSKEDENKGKKD